ncbi:unannotated protein [freshwater metagenome]|uniref:Unannotated protein n=1 Tax=freshwater metagenome TaxID=449393 RepID=A0A6J6GBM7_9ZZZZ
MTHPTHGLGDVRRRTLDAASIACLMRVSSWVVMGVVGVIALVSRW